MSTHNESDVRIVAMLHRLSLPGAERGMELLSGGQSGAAVYQLEMGGERVILKLTWPDAPRHLIEQARREARFYRGLASTLPIPVPRVIEVSGEADEAVAILLAEETPVPHVDHWSENDFLIVAKQLGRLHGAFWDRNDFIPPWVERVPSRSPQRLENAARRWNALGDHSGQRSIIAPHLPKLTRMIECIPELQQRMDAMPETLCHGDCHAGNFLRNERGDLLLADWQQVRRGAGIDDLSFFVQRAFAASEQPLPFEAMVRRYSETLAAEFGVAVSIEQIEQRLSWSELCGWLIDWPEYLGFLPGSSVERILARIDCLNSRLDGE